MQTSQNLTRALDQLKREIQKETTDLLMRENELKQSGVEKQNLENEIRTKETELKQKEIEVQKLKSEIQQAKNKVPELDRQHRRLAEEVTKIRLDQNKKNQDLIKIQKEYSDAVRNMGKK